MIRCDDRGGEEAGQRRKKLDRWVGGRLLSEKVGVELQVTKDLKVIDDERGRD